MFLTIEVKYAGGRTEIQKITVKVSAPGGQGILAGDFRT